MTDNGGWRLSPDSTTAEPRPLVSLTALINSLGSENNDCLFGCDPPSSDSPPKKLEVTQTNSIWMTVFPLYPCAVIPCDCAAPGFALFAHLFPHPLTWRENHGTFSPPTVVRGNSVWMASLRSVLFFFFLYCIVSHWISCFFSCFHGCFSGFNEGLDG